LYVTENLCLPATYKNGMSSLVMLLFLLRPTKEIALMPAAQAIFEDLLRRNQFGFNDIEEAAFIVRDGGGNLRAVAWPSDGEPNSGRWEGAYPAGAVAIAHTHPNWLPLPSSIDAATARQSRMPVYVITTSGISKTTGAEPVTVIAGAWESLDLNKVPGTLVSAVN
jgi:hypothetical protein